STCSTAAATCAAGESICATAATPEGTRLSWKQERQSTGRPWVGLNGTVVSTPQAEHFVRVSVRESGRGKAPVGVGGAAQAGTFGLAELAALGVVLELLVVEKKLLACGKDELVATVRALQNAVREFHAPSPILRDRAETLPEVQLNG